MVDGKVGTAVLRCIVLFLPFVFLRTLLLLALLPTWAAQAQPTPAASPLYADTLRALIVFAQFKDDPVVGDPVLNARDWPLENSGALPAFARTLLAPSPEPPYADSTLTAYFHQQSNGHFVIYGAPYDSVLVSQHPESHYHRPNGGYGYLTQELLDRIDGYGFDFSPYDHNGDSQLDYLFLIIRGDTQRDAKVFTYTGISCLDAMCGGGISAGRPPGGHLVYDSLRVDWRSSGSILMHRTPGNIIPQVYHVRLMAHELGHDLWRPHFNHIPAITDNDVPAASNRTSRATNTIGYALMAGAGGGWDARGDETISAFERERLGWIRCDTLTTTQRDVSLGDLYSTADCKKVELAHGRVLHLTNRQRIGYFDQYRRGGIDGRFEMGLLRTTGLLVTLSDSLRFDVLPADNTLDLSVENAPYNGDLFGPSTQTQLTPWTRPNSNGYAHYPDRFPVRWDALDRIRTSDDAGQTMVFDYLADIREQPIIRENSWMGDETRGTVFNEPVVVTNGSTLHIETMLTLGDGLIVEPGATVIFETDAEATLPEGAVLRLHRAATVLVRGTVRFEGLLHAQPGSTLAIEPGGRIRVSR